MTIARLEVADVNVALPQTLGLLRDSGAGHTAASVANQRPTIEWPGVFVTEYSHPTRCVLFDPVRDANPFFHYLESMWIIAGRNDVPFLRTLLPRMEQYSDDGETFHGAYGHRMRHWGEYDQDQIDQAIMLLQDKPSSRQCVVSIWNPDLDLGAVTKDMPCNDMLMFKVRDGKLNVTVCNRSNDAVLGAYGANVVQFSMLLMYMAARLRVGVGRYTQVSDSMHVYLDDPYWNKFVADETPAGTYRHYAELGDRNLFEDGIDGFDNDLAGFFRAYERADHGALLESSIEPVFETPAVRDCYTIYNVLMLYRQKQYNEALALCGKIVSSDWCRACHAWIKRRVDKLGGAA